MALPPSISVSQKLRFFLFCCSLTFPLLRLSNNKALGSWDVSEVNNFEGMFYSATHFNRPLNAWKIGEYANMKVMFFRATAFDQPLSSWSVSGVTNFYR